MSDQKTCTIERRSYDGFGQHVRGLKVPAAFTELDFDGVKSVELYAGDAVVFTNPTDGPRKEVAVKAAFTQSELRKSISAAIDEIAKHKQSQGERYDIPADILEWLKSGDEAVCFVTLVSAWEPKDYKCQRPAHGYTIEGDPVCDGHADDDILRIVRNVKGEVCG